MPNMTTTPAPAYCPACGAREYQSDDNLAAEYECGQRMVFDNKEWRQSFMTCSRAFESAIALRARAEKAEAELARSRAFHALSNLNNQATQNMLNDARAELEAARVNHIDANTRNMNCRDELARAQAAAEMVIKLDKHFGKMPGDFHSFGCQGPHGGECYCGGVEWLQIWNRLIDSAAPPTGAEKE